MPFQKCNCTQKKFLFIIIFSISISIFYFNDHIVSYISTLPAVANLSIGYVCDYFDETVSNSECVTDRDQLIDAVINKTIPWPRCGVIALILEDKYGGLGNQMFGYASFYGVAKRQERRANKIAFMAIMDDAPYMVNVFDNLSIPIKFVKDSWMDSHKFTVVPKDKIPIKGCCRYNENLLPKLQCDGKNLRFDSYQQSFKYFEDYFGDIRREFEFKKSTQRRCRDSFGAALIEKTLTRNSSILVGVHLRRGDFAYAKKIAFGHSPARADYLERAVRFFEKLFFDSWANSEKGRDLVFLVFGNDHQWNIGAATKIRLLDANRTHWIFFDHRKSTPAIDMCMLRSCHHAIVSTGTFSWWAGFFVKGVVTYQKEYAMPNSGHFTEYTPEDYFLPHWIGL